MHPMQTHLAIVPASPGAVMWHGSSPTDRPGTYLPHGRSGLGSAQPVEHAPMVRSIFPRGGTPLSETSSLGLTSVLSVTSHAPLPTDFSSFLFRIVWEHIQIIVLQMQAAAHGWLQPSPYKRWLQPLYVMLFATYPVTMLDICAIKRSDFIRQKLGSCCILGCIYFQGKQIIQTFTREMTEK